MPMLIWGGDDSRGGVDPSFYLKCRRRFQFASTILDWRQQHGQHATCNIYSSNGNSSRQHWHWVWVQLIEHQQQIDCANNNKMNSSNSNSNNDNNNMTHCVVHMPPLQGNKTRWRRQKGATATAETAATTCRQHVAGVQKFSLLLFADVCQVN